MNKNQALLKILKDKVWGVIHIPEDFFCSSLPQNAIILCVSFPYFHLTSDEAPAENQNITTPAYVDHFAWGYDYHNSVKLELESVVSQICSSKDPALQVLSQLSYKLCVDNTGYDDRLIALYAGIGKVGKNRLIISKDGSKIFIGYIIFWLEDAFDKLPYNLEIPIPNHKLDSSLLSYNNLPDIFRYPPCGNCNLCVRACPARSLPATLQGEAEFSESDGILRCISYLTQTDNIDVSLEPLIGSRLYGCSICQDVCPANKKLKKMRTNFVDPREIILLSNRAFKRKYGHMAFAWRPARIYRRNAYIILGNAGSLSDAQWLDSLDLEEMGRPDEVQICERAIKRIKERIGNDQ